jgi:hypothetical protein
MRRGGGPLGRRRLGRRRHPLRLAALRRLEQAHRLLNQGQPGEAAPLFAELAQGAESFEMPARAAQLHLQAARALSLTGARPGLLEHARKAIDLLAGAGESALLSTALRRFIQELRGQGHAAEADLLQQDLNRALGGAAAEAGLMPAPTQKARLPAACPQCGGPVRSDEVEWIDDGSAECPYCGSTLLSQ